jgi:ketosteroid isomerase-like protein
MSQANGEIIRRHYEAFNRRDLDTVAQYHHPEVEVYPGAVGPDPETGGRGRFRGREEVVQFFANILDLLEVLTVELEEILEAPGDRVLAVERWCVRGRDDSEVVTEIIGVYAFRDGLIVRCDGFLDKAEALEAAGLSEQEISS